MKTDVVVDPRVTVRHCECDCCWHTDKSTSICMRELEIFSKIIHVSKFEMIPVSTTKLFNETN